MSGYASGQHPASRANLTRTGRKPGARNRPKPLLDRVRTAAGRKSIAAVAVLAAIMQDTDQPGAARAILDCGAAGPSAAQRRAAGGGAGARAGPGG